MRGLSFNILLTLSMPHFYLNILKVNKLYQDLQPALRTAGQNPTESEVQDMINKIYDGSASLAFPHFCLLIAEKAKELDPETHFKDTFRVFSKDEEIIQTKDDSIGQLHPSRGEEVCAAAFAREGDLQGD